MKLNCRDNNLKKKHCSIVHGIELIAELRRISDEENKSKSQVNHVIHIPYINQLELNILGSVCSAMCRPCNLCITQFPNHSRQEAEKKQENDGLAFHLVQTPESWYFAVIWDQCTFLRRTMSPCVHAYVVYVCVWVGERAGDTFVCQFKFQMCCFCL